MGGLRSQVENSKSIDVQKHPQIAQLVETRLMKAIAALLRGGDVYQVRDACGKGWMAARSLPFVHCNTSLGLPCLSHPLR